MSTEEIEHLRYPIGRFKRPETITGEILAGHIRTIAQFPAKIEAAVRSLTDAQLDTPYRPQGWTVRQVVHHCADSHLNSYIRFKLALTEDAPTIKPYFEDRWAELHDARRMPVKPSIDLLEGLHARWTETLTHLSEEELDRTFIHPESGRAMSLRITVCLYAWHCAHHLAHIVELKRREGWG
ncbi:MAG TPA: bacillithiol transferase BstA [Flavobacteriales bacterium]|nr:bacillithiol transferase BstA [Flavobacteriales bacterium]